MTLGIDASTIIQALTVAGLVHSATTLWRTSHLVDRLDERTVQHDKRISTLESRSVDAA